MFENTITITLCQTNLKRHLQIDNIIHDEHSQTIHTFSIQLCEFPRLIYIIENISFTLIHFAASLIIN